MIPSYVRSHAQGYLQLNRHASVMKDAGAVVTLDGNGGFGQVVAHEAMQIGIEKAREHGMAAVALRNAHHIGRIGYWAEQCAAAGMISIHFVNVVGNVMVAPFRGKDSRFGTNPLCVVFPRAAIRRCCWITPPAPSPSVKPASPGIKASGTGGVADRRSRRPHTDPAVMQTSPLGALLTFAEHKGYALATLCEIIGGAVSGGKTSHQETLQGSVDAIFNCMTTIILSPEAFDAPDMQRETEAFIDWCKRSPHDPDAPILAPGEWEEANCRQAQGIRWTLEAEAAPPPKKSVYPPTPSRSCARSWPDFPMMTPERASCHRH
jgi:uncharacterized oxidoreductase